MARKNQFCTKPGDKQSSISGIVTASASWSIASVSFSRTCTGPDGNGVAGPGLVIILSGFPVRAGVGVTSGDFPGLVGFGVVSGGFPVPAGAGPIAGS